MQTKYLGRIIGWQTIDVINKRIKIFRIGHLVALVKLKGAGQESFAKPNGSEGGQQTFVTLIGDTTAILHLAKHID